MTTSNPMGDSMIRRLRPLFITLAAGLAAAGALAQPAGRLVPEVVAGGLQNPWGLAFIGDGRLLVTERPGRMRVVEADGRLGPALKGLPEVDAVGQGGLLDVIADRDFATNRTVHFCYSEPALVGNSTAMASARLSDDRSALENVRVVFSQKPKVGSRLHFGCRIVQAADGSFFLTLGDRYLRMHDAQTLDNHHGKVVRVLADGKPHPDNPFAKQARALPEIWTLGHRNIQGAALGPDGALWTIEHGPQGGDELNRPEAGKNYGWPVITYGENYGGGSIGDGLTSRAGLEQPVQYWVPSIAPSGLVFLRSDKYGPAWQGNGFTGSLKFRHLVRLQMEGGRVVQQERLLTELNQRIRDVREGPDGWLYVLTDDSDGKVLRLTVR
jgi:glucose/arabinose dehydrogenase